MDLDFIEELPAEWYPQIQEYLSGQRKKFDVKITLTGTDFQKAVWNETLEIPYGEVRTYGEIAQAIGKPFAARAVGSACGANKFPIVIPCHRVVGSNGIGGYGYNGPVVKRALLRIEGITHL
ncbi:MAG: methylated-DNA--[protein]-cysteine S-methyltransferase [Candidatus Nomurabacteria bacterium]|jgi:methylated-DNA-[protein]-cysteine S-methyltransferase|nr:methylated-DNA--[protein]-cysteine S-methyltransferase [Candidatus Nomurabacteria bacterium]